MTRSTARLLGGFILSAIAVPGSPHQTPDEGREGSGRVGRHVWAAASRGEPRAFAAELAAARVPVGMVLNASDSEPRGAMASLRTDRDETGVPLAETLVPVAGRGRAVDMLTRAVRAANGEPAPTRPGGIVGSGAASAEMARRVALMETGVSLNVDRGTLEEALDAIVRGAPGTGWGIREVRQEGPGGLRRNVVLFTDGPWPQSRRFVDPSPD